MKPVARTVGFQQRPINLDVLSRHHRPRIFERILLVSDTATYQQLNDAFAENLFNLNWVNDGADAIRAICKSDFEAVLCDVTPCFPTDAFYLAVQRTKVYLTQRLLFFVGQTTDPKTVEFLRKRKAAMLWKPYEHYVLFETIENIVRKTSQLVSLSETKDVSVQML